MEYYNSVSTCFENDKAFEHFVTGVWSIDKLYYEKKKKLNEARYIKKAAPESESGEELRAEKKVSRKTASKATNRK